MTVFRLGASVAENVARLRVALGSATRPLSRDDLAKLITAEHPNRALSGSSVERWEKDGVEPDYESVAIMAALAGVTFEEFARGTRRPLVGPVEDSRNEDVPDPAQQPARRRAANGSGRTSGEH